MQVIVKKGLMFLRDKGNETMMDCPEADAIARANGKLYAENMTKDFDGKTLVIDDKTLVIKEIQEDFL